MSGELLVAPEQAEELLRRMFQAAVAAADPAKVVPAFLPEPPAGRTVVVGAGKASAAMAQALEAHWPGPLSGVVVTAEGCTVACARIRILEAAHPVPDARSEAAARAILDAVSSLSPEDLVIALISGGGSALMALPAPGLTLADKQAVNRALLRCGADIAEMNCVRKHLSAIKGGRLAAAAYPARVLTLAISDVPGDDPAVIASGPTVPDPTTFAEARAILDKYGIEAPAAVRAHLARAEEETPKPGDPRLARCAFALIATPQKALEAAAAEARKAQITPMILSDSIEGEAREVARVLGAIAREVRRFGQPIAPPCVLLSGGETTVTVRGDGKGGRNVEFLLALALALKGERDIWALAADTDGIDGAEPIAGAIVSPDTLARAQALGLDAKRALANNDAHSFFAALGAQLITGPTRTNVNDFRAILVL